VRLLVVQRTVDGRTKIFEYYQKKLTNHGNLVGKAVRQTDSLSVCLSDAFIVTKLNDGLRIFWYHTKRQSL